MQLTVAVNQRAVDRLDEETRTLHVEVDAEVAALLGATSAGQYRRFLARAFGFIAPLERSLLDTEGLAPFLDPRRLHKRSLLQSDLQTLGLKPPDIASLPQCMWIPWFEDVHAALGWAYIIERSTHAHPALFRHLAAVLPGEAAFASSFLKCYATSLGENWQAFAEGVDASIKQPADLDAIVAGAKTGYRFYRRWRNMLDGRAASGPQEPIEDREPVAAQVGRASADDSQRLPPTEES